MEFSVVTKKYWEEKDWQDVDAVQSVAELYAIAQRIINRMPKPFGQVCGPISTGGAGSRDANLEIFNLKIKELQSKGLNIFDQMPYEDSIGRLYEEAKKQGRNDVDILNDFYLHIFKSGNVNVFYFLPDWQSSVGATWEHEKAKELGVKIVYL